MGKQRVLTCGKAAHLEIGVGGRCYRREVVWSRCIRGMHGRRYWEGNAWPVREGGFTGGRQDVAVTAQDRSARGEMKAEAEGKREESED